MSERSLPDDIGPEPPDDIGPEPPDAIGPEFSDDIGPELSDDSGPEFSDALPEYAERVLDATEAIPPGRVMTYGDVAEWLGEGGPRQVGRVMSLYGGGVPWWRVVRADGVLLPGHELEALARYREEGTPLKEANRAAEDHLPRIDMRRARWDGGGHAQVHT